ncbi:MAG TPA: FAD-linked oxidase C-terminal domain-containing protein [Chloroflexia bacterium]|nr:FAD-linked oxidase C-terminal domain-containing protein [Chloroflexia bacterium]
MAKSVTQLRVIVSSPSDVAEQRNEVEKIIRTLSTTLSEDRQLVLEPVLWETYAKPGVGKYSQEVIQPQLGDFDIFVSIFWTRIGSPTPKAISAAVEELNLALDQAQAAPDEKKVMVYFSSQATDPTKLDTDQVRQVQELRRDLAKNKGVFYGTFSSPEQFKELLGRDLTRAALEYSKKWGRTSQVPLEPQAITVTPLEQMGIGLEEPFIKNVRIFESQDVAGFSRLIKTATDTIDILQTYVPGIEGIKAALLAAYENGCKIRILVLRYNSSYLGVRLNHLERGKEVALASLEMLRAVVREAKSPKGQIEIKAYDFIPYFPYYRMDNHLFIGFYLREGSLRLAQVRFDVEELNRVFPELLSHFEHYWQREDNMDLISAWEIEEKLKRIGLPITTAGDACQAVSRDASLYKGDPIGLVRFEGAEDLASVERKLKELMKIAAEKDIPLTFVGSRTSVAGQATNRKGIVIDMSNFQDLQLSPVDAKTGPYAQAGPGIILDDLNKRIRQRLGSGLTTIEFEHTLDLSSSHMATLGGAIMNNGGGIMSTKYGSACDNVTDLEVLLPDGRRTWTTQIAETGRFSDVYRELYSMIQAVGTDRLLAAYPVVKKNSSGYNLRPLANNIKRGEPLDVTQLFVGSEGTLGVLLRAKIKIRRITPPKATVLSFFGTIEEACWTVEDVLRIKVNGTIVLPSALEIVDGSIFEVIKSLRIELPKACQPPENARAAVLLVEYDDPEEIAVAAGKQLEEVCKRHIEREGNDPDEAYRLVTSSTERDDFWYLRKSVVQLLNDYGKKHDLVAPPIIEDPGVPVGQLGKFIEYLQREFDTLGFRAAIFGHAGDGNLHVRPLLRPEPDQMRMAANLMKRVYDKVIGMKGTISAEHGDGLLRTPFLTKQYGTEVTDVFRQIKELFDPKYVLNPGVKVPQHGFPEEVDENFEKDWDIMGYLPTGGGRPANPRYEDIVR